MADDGHAISRDRKRAGNGRQFGGKDHGKFCLILPISSTLDARVVARS